MEERKNSYKLSFSAKVEIAGFPGGRLGLVRMAEEFNNNMISENIEHSYAFADPNLFVARAIV